MSLHYVRPALHCYVVALPCPLTDCSPSYVLLVVSLAITERKRWSQIWKVAAGKQTIKLEILAVVKPSWRAADIEIAR